jgi:type I restriction enzyme S subunit
MAVKKKEASLSIEDKLRAALVADDKQLYPIPENWVWTRLGEISLDPQYGWTTSAASEGDVQLLRTTDITSGQIDWTSVPYCKEIPADLEKYLIRDGDIVISRAGSVGFSNLIKNPEKAVFASYLIRFKPLIVQEYLAHFLKSQTYWAAISESSSGIAVPNVNASKLKQISIPVAPLSEQQRIAAKLESLLGKIKEAKALLDEIPEILENFRQTVLAAAYSGRLTSEWREKNANVEPASNLLIRIHERRMALVQSKKERMQITEAFEERNLLIDNDALGFDDIPLTWATCRIGAIGTVCNGSTPSRKVPEFWGGDIPWVSSGEVHNNIISETREWITKKGFKGSSVRFLPSGTVLLAMIGEGKTRGQSAVLAIKATINQNIAAVIIDHQLVRSDYVWRWFQFQYEATREQGGGSGPQALNCQRVRELPFVLPPLSEQQEIVQRIESLFSKADDFETQYKEAMEQIESLPEIILSKAFRGELVPQDPNDEPASVLLNRIRAAKGTAIVTGKQTRGKKAIRSS